MRNVLQIFLVCQIVNDKWTKHHPLPDNCFYFLHPIDVNKQSRPSKPGHTTKVALVYTITPTNGVIIWQVSSYYYQIRIFIPDMVGRILQTWGIWLLFDLFLSQTFIDEWVITERMENITPYGKDKYLSLPDVWMVNIYQYTVIALIVIHLITCNFESLTIYFPLTTQ